MSEAYNSKLISSLYLEKDDRKIIELLEQVDETSDEIFLYPLYDKYKANRDSFISHYYIGSISKIKSNEAEKILKEIANDRDTEEGDLPFVLPRLTEASYDNESLVSRVEAILYLLDKDEMGHTLQSSLSYLKTVRSLDGHEERLKEIFQNEEYSNDLRRIALSFLLRNNSKKWFQYYFDNYSELKDKFSEIIFVKELLTWSNGIIPKFLEKITSEGSIKARELVEAKLKKDKSKDQEKEKEESINYSNAKEIKEVSEEREKLNNSSIAAERIGFALLSPTEIFSKQVETPKDKNSLVAYCVDLRAAVQLFVEKTGEHGVNLDDARLVIDGIGENALSSPLNKLHLLLHSKGIIVPKDLFGLRDLVSVLNKISHPESIEGRMEILQKQGLWDLYDKEEWSKLHVELLRRYIKVLQLMRQSFS